MEVHLDYPQDTGNPVSEHSSDGEVITVLNTFKEAMESPQVTKWKEAKQGDGQLPETRSLQPGISRLSTTGAQGGRDQMRL